MGTLIIGTEMSGQLEGERIYLHTSGLSKARRKIFESWIVKEGGKVVVGDPKEGVVAVVEDKLLEGATLASAIQKMDGKVLVVGLSWLSCCIEKSKRVSEVPYVLRSLSAQSGESSKRIESKRRFHDLSDSEESEAEDRGISEQVKDFGEKTKEKPKKHQKPQREKQNHNLSDSDEEIPTTVGGTSSTKITTGLVQGKISGPPSIHPGLPSIHPGPTNANIARELGEPFWLKVSSILPLTYSHI